MQQFLILLVVLAVVGSVAGKKGYIRNEVPVEPLLKSPLPHTYIREDDLPTGFDWRNVNGTNYCARVITQQSPNVCGSCWAEAATGAVSDRYNIATGNKLRVQLAPQQLINFNERTSGGSCNGGNDLKAYQFMNKYGISDDTCAPFTGLNWQRGFEVAAMTDVDEVQSHQCYVCDWNGACGFAPRNLYDLYGVDEYGEVSGVVPMKSEIYARGPISCSLNSDAVSFDEYWGGIIKCDKKSGEKQCRNKVSDHVIIIAGWGYDEETKTEYWIGRNSYGARWGEGAGGGWFRLELGTDALNIESSGCAWAVPAKADVQRAIQQFEDAL